MFCVTQVLSPQDIEQLHKIAAAAQFVDGRISNPHSTVKNNLQLHEPQTHEQSADILRRALLANDQFRSFSQPKAIAPPMLTRYSSGMYYGVHADTALMHLPKGTIRADLSCTVFLSDPAQYEGGALRIQIGSAEIAFKEPAGTAVIYPSTTLHEVEPVTRGERLVGLTFIQSFVADCAQRELLFELGEVAALEGLNMAHANFTRLQAVQHNLLRRWSDAP